MILYFSGNGNSRLVAEALGRRLADDVCNLSGGVPEHCTPGGDGALCVWVFPVHSWGVPPYVRELIRSSAAGWLEGARHVMVATCGDDCGLTYSQWAADIGRRGWSVESGFSVFMPNTYVNLPGFDVDAPDVERQKLRDAAARVKEIASRISAGERVVDVHQGCMAWIKTRVVYPLFVRFMMSPRKFSADDRCVGCGACVAVCPRRNIVIDTGIGKPKWGDSCSLCMGCYHACRHGAVNRGRSTSGKGRYRAPSVLD